MKAPILARLVTLNIALSHHFLVVLVKEVVLENVEGV